MHSVLLHEALAAIGTRRTYPKSALIIQERDPGGSLYCLVNGQVRAFSMNEDGKEIIYGIYGAGEVFGEMALDGGPRSASVVCIEPCECIEVSIVQIRQLIVNRPDIAFDLINLVIRRARQTTEAARRMVLLDVYGRLRMHLLQLALPASATQPLKRELPPLTQAQIGAAIGASREMVSRLFKDLEQGGYLEETRSKVWTILKPLPERW